MKNIKKRIILTLLTACLIAGCSKESTTSTTNVVTDKPVVYTVNYPLYYFATRIAADHAQIIFPAPPDIDPPFWNPDAQQIQKLQQADLILLNGATYAKWLTAVSLPASITVNTSEQFANDYIANKEITIHSHGPEGKHEHGNIDFTTWIDPLQAKIQVQAITKALIRLIPEQETTFKTNEKALLKGLDLLNHQLQTVFNNTKEPLIASHPVYSYFARRYQLNLKSLHWEPDQIPDAQEWQKLQDMLKTHPAKIMIWEGEPLEEVRQKLNELDLKIAVFSPSANTPETGDYMTEMKKNLENLTAVFPADK